MDKAVVQKDRMGCGLACIAFVTGLEYEDVAAYFKKENSTIIKDIYCKDVVRLLKIFKRDYRYNYLKPRLIRKIYQKGAIVYVRKCKKYPRGHYLARANGCWMDPWINLTADRNIEHAEAGFRKRLPGKPIYIIYPDSIQI